MRKIQLLMLFVLSAIIFQGCKKDVVTSASTTSDQILAATINGTSWIPDDVTATITYDAATKTKSFDVVGTIDLKRVKWTVTLSDAASATNVNSFPLSTYRVDTTARVKMAYYTSTDGTSYAQVGTVEPGSGSIIITSIDPTKNVITGTYSLTAKKVNYNDDGTISSIETSQILGGTFTNLPYTFNVN
ncbi:hypothetical protein SAMN05192574_103283 [Mucilaginibacter gossypiicola]|uniref:Uncharacterized protein n=1 Tax=Mucilaginibacter gossypiicola TaxID=551995 RepID=A0A1H8GUD8_9SPHI|nr:DUF6252 family protein [Mucilaginibacter gossypiicola]SEN47672.1 hypothetical protein SAMN05192574_103283 [Mucilaginibacter gossypiicola]